MNTKYKCPSSQSFLVILRLFHKDDNQNKSCAALKAVILNSLSEVSIIFEAFVDCVLHYVFFQNIKVINSC